MFICNNLCVVCVCVSLSLLVVLCQVSNAGCSRAAEAGGEIATDFARSSRGREERRGQKSWRATSRCGVTPTGLGNTSESPTTRLISACMDEASRQMVRPTDFIASRRGVVILKLKEGEL